ncbi:hypothetical protein FO519_005516 [Halicephalobus sp. NKZ332]|nr:hypothetical protein FO519_005516 [Halicephalobus sp. NKZ332]
MMGFYELLPCGVFTLKKKQEHMSFFLIFGLLTILIHLALGLIFGFLLLPNFLTLMLEKHNELQKQVIISLTIQCILPLLCLVLPYGLLILEAIINSQSLAGVTNTLITLGGLHSFFHSVVIISIIKPYRNAIVDFVKKMFGISPDTNAILPSNTTQPLSLI